MRTKDYRGLERHLSLDVPGWQEATQARPLCHKRNILSTSASLPCWAAGGRRAYAQGVAYERISVDPNRMSGLPCIRDTRVTVSAVLGQLAAGLTITELLADCFSLTSPTWTGRMSSLPWSSLRQLYRNVSCR